MTGPRFLIVGTGRSGTRYCADVLRAGGLTVGHQTWRHDHTLGRPFDWPLGMHGIVSFEAVPALPVIRDRFPDVRVILVRRDPRATARSWVELGAFQGDMRDRWLLFGIVLDKHLPGWDDSDTALRRAFGYASDWQRMAAVHADTEMWVEDMTTRDLYAAVGWADAWTPEADRVPTDRNHELIDD